MKLAHFAPFNLSGSAAASTGLTSCLFWPFWSPLHRTEQELALLLCDHDSHWELFSLTLASNLLSSWVTQSPPSFLLCRNEENLIRYFRLPEKIVDTANTNGNIGRVILIS